MIAIGAKILDCDHPPFVLASEDICSTTIDERLSAYHVRMFLIAMKPKKIAEVQSRDLGRELSASATNNS